MTASMSSLLGATLLPTPSPVGPARLTAGVPVRLEVLRWSGRAAERVGDRAPESGDTAPAGMLPFDIRGEMAREAAEELRPEL